MLDSVHSEIVDTAIDYIGQEEIKGNQGFKVAEFQQKLENVGWDIGHAWCTYFCEAVWKEAYQQWDATLFTRLDKLFSGSAVQTFRNFQKTKDFICSNKPVKGALAVWQKYKNGNPHWSGHIAIVQSFNVKQNWVLTIDGNTNDQGGREGYIVAPQKRLIKSPLKQNSLNLMGFVHPKNI